MKKIVRISFLCLFIFLTGCVNNNEEIENAKNLQHTVGENTKGVIRHDDIAIFPQPNSIIEISIDTLGEELPESKDDGELPVILHMTVEGTILETYGSIKVQGTSTAKWPKKNWSFSFFDDEMRSQEISIKIGDSIASNKWIAKADWIDPSMLRNSISYGLWEDIVKSRDSVPIYEVDNAWIKEDGMLKGHSSAAQGFPKIYPTQVKVDGEHYGISMLLLGHDPDNFNIDKNNPKHVYMEFDARGGYTKTKTWEKFSAEGIDQWIDGYHPKNEDFSEEQKGAIDKLGEVINGTQANFNNNFDNYFDKRNIIDMLIFIEAIYDWDAVAQDLEIVSYDLEKWYFLPWDKDTTFGMWWDESGISEDSADKLVINYDEEKPSEKLWYKTYHAFTDEVESRYSQLRRDEVLSVKNLYNIISDVNKKIPGEIWKAELDRWANDQRPSLDETSSAQILDWFETRLIMLDNQFNYR